MSLSTSLPRYQSLNWMLEINELAKIEMPRQEDKRAFDFATSFR